MVLPLSCPWYYLCYVLGMSYDKYGHGIAFVMSLAFPMLCPIIAIHLNNFYHFIKFAYINRYHSVEVFLTID